ncbi:MAG: polyprenyl diphosphate synthase [Steroidobacteraceae bacterium]
MVLAQQGVQDPPGVPRHVAIVMDGNGRWAQQRGLPRTDGHREGSRVARATVEHAIRRGVGALTLFAFSSENWTRPAEEVDVLMQLFLEALDTQARDLIDNGVRLSFIGDRSTLSAPLQEDMARVEVATSGNTRLRLQVAVSYGGRWDILQATRQLAAAIGRGELGVDDIDEQAMSDRLSLAGLPDPDLFIRTGGERRISNFLLWNLAYTELYFCDTAWPEFSADHFDQAIDYFAGCERRFGATSHQVRGGP